MGDAVPRTAAGGREAKGPESQAAEAEQRSVPHGL
jgi:hypothetical protein